MRCTNFGCVKTLFLIVNIFCAKAKLLVCDKTEEKDQLLDAGIHINKMHISNVYKIQCPSVKNIARWCLMFALIDLAHAT